MRTKYIYLLTNKINGKRYVGQTYNLENRFYRHFRWYEGDSNTLFVQEKTQYGNDNFEITVLEEVVETEAHAREKYWIKELKTYLEYNIMLSSGTTENELEEIISMFENGKTLVDIEKEKHIDRKRLSSILAKRNIDPKQNHKYRPLQEEKYLVAKNMYLNGKTIREISEELKICRKTLSKKFKADNLIVIKPNENRHKHPYQIPIAT
jgi:group I intron endonuclease